MSNYDKQDVKNLYSAFTSLCDFIENNDAIPINLKL